MRKFLKFGAVLFGVVALFTGTSSCKKDKEQHICCSWVDGFITYKYCQDSPGMTATDWTEVVQYTIDYAGTCKAEDK